MSSQTPAPQAQDPREPEDKAARQDATARSRSNGEAGLAASEDETEPLWRRKTVLIGLAASMGFVFGQAIQPSSTIVEDAASVRRWTPSTAYVHGQTVVNPNNDVVSARVGHTSSAVYTADTAKWTPGSSRATEDAFVNVLHTGVIGDGTTDDTAAINAAIAANPGKVLLFPSGRTYQIRADLGENADHGGGIRLNRAGTVLWLYGARIRMSASIVSHYQMVDVTAADCQVLGGLLIGDAVNHAGKEGEWGHGLSVGGGADRFAARDVYVTRCWGDGFYIWGRPIDVSLTNCTGDDNRRQGLSIVDAVRPRVTGGAYINNGITKFTNPGGGIDLEPDPGTSRDVIDAVVTGVTLMGNKGPGFGSSSNGRTVTATVTGCRSIGNGLSTSSSGFLVTGVNNHVTFNACEAKDNTSDGWLIRKGVIATQLNGNTAQLNRRFGINDAGTGTQITSGSVDDNGGTGLLLAGVRPTILGLSARGNCTAGITNVQVDINSTTAILTGVKSICGGNATKPAYGYVVRPDATNARLIGCDASGPFTSAIFADLTVGKTAITLGVPGGPGAFWGRSRPSGSRPPSMPTT